MSDPTASAQVYTFGPDSPYAGNFTTEATLQACTDSANSHGGDNSGGSKK